MKSNNRTNRQPKAGRITAPKRILASLLCLLLIATTILPQTAEGYIKTKAASHTLQNPTKDSDGNVTWDCVWFGSYPQTEIVSASDTTQLAAMEKMNTYYETKYETVSASSYQQIAGAAYNSNGDATVNGVKYRRMKKGDATYSATNDSYYYQWADSESYHYFRYEPIKWRVLSVEGNDALLLADTGLDDRRYNESYVSITWETCTMRSWLNGYGAASNKNGNDYSSNNFLNSAFSSAEQAAVRNSTVVNDDNPYYGTAGGNDTTDKVFLLSIDEALKADYGFSTDYSTYDKARRAKTSTYAKAMGCWGNTDTEYAGCDWWWLRSPGDSTYGAAYVSIYGSLRRYGYDVHYDDYAVRPALHLNLSSSSSLYSYAGTVSSKGTMDEEEPGHVSGGGSGGGSSSTTTEESRVVTNGSLSAKDTITVGRGEENSIKVTISADTGEEVKTLYRSLKVESKDTSVATAGTNTLLGIEPITWDTSYSAYIDVAGVALGETEIVITVSDGSKLTCKVTVEKSKAEVEEENRVNNFNMYLYRSDLLTSDSSTGATMENYINNDTPTEIFVRELQDNNFGDTAAAWRGLTRTLDTALDASNLVDYALEEEDIYTAMILNALEASCKIEITDTINADFLKDSSKLLNIIKMDLKTNYQIDVIDSDAINDVMTEEMKQRSLKVMSDYFEEQKFSKSVKWLDKFEKGMKYAATVEDFVEESVAYVNIRYMNDSMKMVLQELYNQCPSSNQALKKALQKCISVINASDSEFMQQFAMGELKLVGKEALKAGISWLWEKGVVSAVKAACPRSVILIAAYKTSKYFTNTMFNTDTITEQYYKMCATTEFNNLSRAAYQSLKSKYKSSKTIDTAQDYLSSIDYIFTVLRNDCDEADAYVDALGDGVYSKIVSHFTGAKDREALKKQIKGLKNDYIGEYGSTLKDWIYNLEEDYPQLYPQYSHLLEETEQRLKEYRISCPVDIYVYDKDNKLVASVVDNIPSSTGLTVMVEGAEKTIYFNDDSEYTIKYVGNDSGDMDITVKEYTADNTVGKTVMFDDIPLEKGLTYQSVEKGLYQSKSEYSLITEDSDIMEPDYDNIKNSVAKEHVVSIQNGVLLRNGVPYNKASINENERVEIQAYIPDGYEFVNWSTSSSVQIQDISSSSTEIIVGKADADIVANLKKIVENDEKLDTDNGNHNSGIGNNSNNKVSSNKGGVNNTNSYQTSTGNKAKVTAPKRAVIKKLTIKNNRRLKVTFRKVTGAKGYQIAYATNKKFKGQKMVTTKKLSCTLKKLKKNKRYYVRVRAYKLSDGKKVYGKWSVVKKKKTKK